MSPKRPAALRRQLARMSLAGILLAASAACGSDDDGDGTSTIAPATATTTTMTETAPPERATVRVAAAAADPSFAALWVAAEQGLFEAQNLDVEISVVGSNVTTSVVSGQADVGVIGPAGALAPVNQSQETSIIYYQAGGGLGGFVATGSPDVMTASDCARIGSIQPGSSGYAWTRLYETIYDGSWDHVTFGDTPTVVAAVVSGQIDCAVSGNAAFAPAIDEGRLDLIIDHSDQSSLHPDLQEFSLVEGSLWGMTDNLESKRDAIVRFIRAWNQADQFNRQASSEEIAALLLEDDNFAAFSLEDLAARTELVAYAWAPNNGYIAETDWSEQQLEFFQQGGLEFVNPADELWSYSQRIDMSYHDEALS